MFGVYDGGAYGALERVSDHLPIPALHQPRQRLWQIVARRTVLATGAIERPLVFGGNDKPGVILASALRSYVNRFATAPGRKIAFFLTSDDGWHTAQDVQRAGLDIEIIVDARKNVAEALTRPLARAGVRILTDAVVTDARRPWRRKRDPRPQERPDAALCGGRARRFRRATIRRSG